MYLFYSEENRIINKEISRNLLYASIKRYFDMLGGEIPSKRILNNLKYTDKGKPYIDDFINFSISHTENIWAIIFYEKNCGLDIQVSRTGDFVKIGERVFSKSDVLKIKECGDKVFFKLWTRKEAYIKALGGTIFEEVPELFNLDNKIYLNGYTIFDFDLINDLYSSVCIEGIQENLNIKKVKL